MQEQVRHLAKGIDPALRRTAPYRVFEFGDDGIGLLHNTFAVFFWAGKPANSACREIRMNFGTLRGD
jgi:hypothetical protein